MTPQEMEKLPKPLEKTISKLELEVMGEVVDRIKKAYEIAPVGEHMLDRLTVLDINSSSIRKLLKEKLEQANIDIDKIYDKAVEADYITHKDLFTKAGKEYTAYEDNEWLKQLVNATREQTKEELKPFENITRTTGFKIAQNGKLVFTPLSDYFAKSLDKSLIGIASGAYTYSQAIGSVIDEMTNSGLRVVSYASGKTDRVEVAVRRALMTGVAQMTNQINESNAKKLNTEYFEVDWHPGARNKGFGIENHQAWQGKVYSKQEMITVCGEGDILGFAGINCYHIKWPFIKGISKRKYTDEWLEEQNEKENTPKEFKGKDYTVYDALQYQRKLERTIRKLKQDVMLLSRAEVDKDVLIAKQSKLQSVKALYAEFSKVMGLPQQMERLRVAKEDNIIENTNKNGIIVAGGVSGARDPDSEEANEHAERYYALVRKMSTDVEKIAKTTGRTKEEIQSIKNYIFIDEHEFSDGQISRFDADFMMAQSWQRLMTGNPEPHDITLINHEIMEKDLMSKGFTQEEAHLKTSEVYNYGKEAREFYDKIGKYKRKR